MPGLSTTDVDQLPSPGAPARQAPTAVRAQVDVGYGNALFIRGEGDGLSWQKGAPLECTAPSTWVWKTETVRERLVFKLLLNDSVWAQGEDLSLPAGESVDVFPKF